MAIRLTTEDPQRLIERIRQAIDRHEILTWSYDNDGDFTISREQWRYHAWMRPVPEQNRLSIGIIQSRKYPMTYELYGVFHGRFVSTLLAHFADDIQSIEVTPALVPDLDIVDTN